MKIAVRVGKHVGHVAAACVLALPAAALAQYSGSSHPDNAPIMNNPSAQQTLYPAVPPPSAAPPQPELKPRPGVPYDATPAVTTATVAIPEPMPEIHETRRDIDAGIVTRIPGPPNQLPIGTLVKVALAQDISTENTPNGTKFTAQLTEPMARDGVVLIPAGSTISGMVTDIHGGKRHTGAPSLHLRTTSVTLPDGTQYQLRGQVIDTSLFKDVKIDREGTMFRRDHAGKVASGMALTAGSGMAAGAVIAGIPGAVVGAGVGAGIGTIVLLRQDRQMELPQDAKVTFWLTEPLTVGGR
jgi:hypothetical protein